LLSDIVVRPSFDPVELEREKQVVLEEIRMVDYTPDDLIYDLFAEHFWPHHPLGRPIQGTERTVGALNRRRMQGFFRRSYRPDRMMVVAAGNLDAAALSRQVRTAFRDLASNGGTVRPERPPKPQAGIVRRKKRDLEQIHLLMGLPAFPRTPDERYALHTMNALLGGTMSSRLFQTIREERGLAYSVFSGASLFRDCGFLMIYAGTRPDRGREVVQLALAELADLRERGPSEEELVVAKEHLKGSLMLSLESTASRMSNLARQEIYYGRRVELGQIVRGIDRVTVGRVRGLARRLFDDPPLALAAIGNLDRFRMAERELKL
ncbi:MAG: insulinase family protein, partial [Planctomycetota bacterium]|nr:insulinase family protein [Planctomycetota bacterium]